MIASHISVDFTTTVRGRPFWGVIEGTWDDFEQFEKIFTGMEARCKEQREP